MMDLWQGLMEWLMRVVLVAAGGTAVLTLLVCFLVRRLDGEPSGNEVEEDLPLLVALWWQRDK